MIIAIVLAVVTSIQQAAAQTGAGSTNTFCALLVCLLTIVRYYYNLSLTIMRCESLKRHRVLGITCKILSGTVVDLTLIVPIYYLKLI